MKLLDISREDAIDIIKCDEQIDKGQKLFELTDEQKQAEKKMRGGAKAVNAYGRTVTKEKKVDEDKAHLMKLIETVIKYNDKVTDFDLTNPEREINFKYGDRKFKIVLSAPRK